MEFYSKLAKKYILYDILASWSLITHWLSHAISNVRLQKLLDDKYEEIK